MSEPLVLVPGLNCTRALFGPQIAAFEGARPVLVANHTRDDTIPEIARRLLADAPPRFGLLGLSMGGYVALEVMRQAPGRVARLALLDTSARPDTDESKANRERLIALAGTDRFAEVADILWQRYVAPHRQNDAALARIVMGMQRETGPQTFARQQRAIMGRVDSRPDLPGIEIPTLVLVGEDDVITPPEHAREIAEAIEWASLVVVPGCGHLSTLESPGIVNEAIGAWLAAGA
ncbi:alpha/beta fold hydrolase [Salinarimonas soli]|uniref:Alpha/beta fold hydrolase n=1 Tax=Salinarimonas soli TaxID=1638099 RepID=A0A5B2V8N2_9HYPH|nr:alpha/beta fold hydrolase [Salinarimonas soli]KAA2235354.1 alpha/beta fold hydrolase [Salinarimonas soli]